MYLSQKEMEQVGKSDERERGEFGPKEIVHARSRRCAIRDIVKA
jgi:hypothetical protein